MYVADTSSHRIMRWSVNATQGTIVAGSLNGIAGSTALLLYNPFDLKLDADENFLYVSDKGNNRIQRFPL